VAEVIEHVVAATINYTCLENGVVETGRAHNFLGGPFGFVIGRTTIWPRAQEAKENNLAHSSLAGRFDRVLCSFDVYALVRLRANLTIDASAVGYGLTARKRASKLVRIG
jgi:hypothetical protein